MASSASLQEQSPKETAIFCPKSLQHYGIKAGSPRPPAKGVQSMANMSQQDSACRKQKNIRCLVNITLPTSSMDGSPSWKCKDQLRHRHRALLKAVPALPNTWQCCREAGKAPEKEENTTDELSGERGIKPHGREGLQTTTWVCQKPATPSTLKQQGKPQRKGKCHCIRTLQCAVRHKLGKSPISFPSSMSISARRREHTHVLAAL